MAKMGPAAGLNNECNLAVRCGSVSCRQPLPAKSAPPRAQSSLHLLLVTSDDGCLLIYCFYSAMAAVRQTSRIAKYRLASQNGDESSVVKWINQYRMGEFLGEGTFAKVYRAVIDRSPDPQHLPADDDEGGVVAIKVFNRNSLQRKRDLHSDGTAGTALDRVRAEIAILAEIGGCGRDVFPFVIHMREVIDDPEYHSIFLVLEMAEFGPIMQWQEHAERFHCPNSIIENCSLSSGPSEHQWAVPESLARKVFRQLCIGLSSLHENGIVHRDIKPNNLLLTSTLDLRICDFGEAELSRENDHKLMFSDTAGTYAFNAPESCTGEEYDGIPCDTWSAGITLFCFVYGKPPFYSTNLNALFNLIEKQPLEFPFDAGEVCSLLIHILDRDVSSRPSLADILHHNWLSDNL